MPPLAASPRALVAAVLLALVQIASPPRAGAQEGSSVTRAPRKKPKPATEYAGDTRVVEGSGDLLLSVSETKKASTESTRTEHNVDDGTRSRVTVTVGMDASFAATSANGGGESRTSIDLPTGLLRVDVGMTNELRLEGLLGVVYSKAEGAPSASTNTTLGLLLDYTAPRRTSSFGDWFIGGGVTYNRFGAGGESFSQFGLLARAGLDVPMNGVLSFRPALFYRRLNSSHDVPANNEFGLMLGLTALLDGQVQPSPARFNWTFGATLELERPKDLDGVSAPKSTTLQLPAPYVGAYWSPTADNNLSVGSWVQFQYISVGDSKQRHLELIPRAEYSITGPYRTARGFRVGLEGIIDNLHFDSGGSSDGGTQYGVGGDIAYTIPFGGTVWRVGVGYDHRLENSGDHIPGANVFSVRAGYSVW
jgi:hypothetical protein